MKQRLLGKTTVNVSRIGLGCVTFGREIDEAASFDVLDHALASGINLFDTAEAYGGGQSRLYRRNNLGIDDSREVTDELHSSELILGRWIRSRGTGCRQRIIVQTKVTLPLTRQRILDALDASLRRLQTDVIDLYLLHAFDPNTPLEESLDALATARRAGKIRFAGCSNFSAEQLRSAIELARSSSLARLEVVQSNYNLAVRDIEDALLPLCREHTIGVETYSPLGAGFLTGKYDPSKPDLPAGSRFHIAPGHARIYFHPEKFAIVRRLRELSERVEVPMARLAMSWVMQNQAIDSVLIGARHNGHVDNAIASLNEPLPDEWTHALAG